MEWISKQATATVSRGMLRDHGLSERSVPEVVKPLAEKLGIKELTPEDNVLVFRNVGEHLDDPHGLPRGQVGGFLHVVLMNPPHKHKVTTKSKLCATAVFTVPLELWYDKAFV